MEHKRITIGELYCLFENFGFYTHVKVFDQNDNKVYDGLFNTMCDEIWYEEIDGFGYEPGCVYIYLRRK